MIDEAAIVPMKKMPELHKPTRAELLAARDQTVPDIIQPNLMVLFCGINPGLYSGAVGHHFARPGNRFWPALHRAGFADRQLTPFEETMLLDIGYGITNLVARATASADELTAEELAAGARNLEAKALQHTPRFLAVLGIGAYRLAFGRRQAQLGMQAEAIGPTRIWVLPNPSGLNAHYTLPELAKTFRTLRLAIDAGREGGRIRRRGPA